jgi:DNA-binding PadR family transcriptional regulator
MDKITNTELAILGLVAEAPKHAYRLEQEIVERGMREWTEIGFSSIYYVLNKLENCGWLSSELSAEGSGPARRVYSLTQPGWVAYRTGVETRLANPRPRTGDFFLGLANLPALTNAEACLGLRTYRSILRQRLRDVKAKQMHDQAASHEVGQILPDHVDCLFDYATTLISAELDWVERYLLKNNPGGENLE